MAQGAEFTFNPGLSADHLVSLISLSRPIVSLRRGREGPFTLMLRRLPVPALLLLAILPLAVAGLFIWMAPLAVLPTVPLLEIPLTPQTLGIMPREDPFIVEIV